MTSKNRQLDKMNDDAGYRIGAIASLTGISPDALRVWEKRYNLLQPRRTTSGNRIYSEEDLTRLSLIKSLLDAGDSISKLVNLDIPALKKRVATLLQQRVMEQEVTGPCKVVVVGVNMAMRFAQVSETDQRVQMLAGIDAPEQIDTLSTKVSPDVVIFEIPTLNESHVNRLTQWLEQLGAQQGMVVYRFGNKKVLDRIRHKQFALLRAPVEMQTVISHCDAILRRSMAEAKRISFTLPDMAAPVPAHQFDDKQLARIANVSTTIKCECPHHMAELIIALNAFESYSLQCENQNEQDAALHSYLHRATAQARQTMESALAHLLEAENIAVQ